MNGPAQVGIRVVIAEMVHSPAETRANAHWLLDRCGVIAAFLRNGRVALVKLDERAFDAPGGILRWPVHMDDLVLERTEETAGVRDRSYRVGMACSAGRPLLHAALENGSHALCGAPVRPLPMCDWSITFEPTVPRACPECTSLTAMIPRQRTAGESPATPQPDTAVGHG